MITMIFAGKIDVAEKQKLTVLAIGSVYSCNYSTGTAFTDGEYNISPNYLEMLNHYLQRHCPVANIAYKVCGFN